MNSTTELTSNPDAFIYQILLNGKAMPDSYRLISIDIQQAVYQIDGATLVLALPEENTFEASESSDLVPGSGIEIKLGNGNNPETVFKGIIVNQGIRNRSGQPAELVLRCSHPSVKMSHGQKNACYEQMKDSAILAQIIDGYGLSHALDATVYTHHQLVKYQTNDWDFIVGRARANGMLLYVDLDKLTMKRPVVSAASVVSVEYGNDVIDFECSLESRHQTPSVTAAAWDINTQSLIESKASEPMMNQQGNLKLNTLGGAIGLQPVSTTTTTPLDKNELKVLADAQLLSERLTGLQGTVTFLGGPRLKLNGLLAMKGFGARFNGNALVTGIRHVVSDGTWRTTATLGLKAAWHETVSAAIPASHTWLSGINGLQNGKVKKIESDPEGLFRILVDVPVIEPTGKGIWARMAHFYATSGKGSFFLPEIGDEILLGFLNDDPRFPVILGMMYSSHTPAPFNPGDENHTKAIVTRSGLSIEFHDDSKTVSVRSPAGNDITLSEADKSVRIADVNGNQLIMNPTGIMMSSPKDIAIQAGGKISLQAVSGFSAKASGGDAALEGLNVKARAGIVFSAEGSAGAELKSSGTATIKGAMVLIN